jgi:hypothetical protein
MKTTITTTLLALLALAISPVAIAQNQNKADKEQHDHDKEKKGPNGGLLVHAVEPHFEFFVTKDRKAKITFLGEDNKPIALAKQSISATGGDRANPTRLIFANGEGKDAGSLVSDKPVPQGEHVQLVLQIKVTPDAKAVTERITLHLHDH